MNITELLATLETANVAVNRVPELESEINRLNLALVGANTQVDVQSDSIRSLHKALEDRNATIERLEKELSEARFREQAAQEASDKVISSLRDIVVFANDALPVASNPEPVKVELAPLVESEATTGQSSSDTAQENPTKESTVNPTPEPSTQATDGQSDKPYLGKSWSEAPNHMTPQEWIEKGGDTPWWLDVDV